MSSKEPNAPQRPKHTGQPLDDLSPEKAAEQAPKPRRILFVCLGNICRSPAAQGVMQAIVDRYGASDRYSLDSAGTGNYHVGDLPDARMRNHALARGYVLDHICRQVRPADFDRFDLIIGMDASNVANLKRLAPTVEAEQKVQPIGNWIDYHRMHFDHVPDPYYEGSQGFELALDLLEHACENLYISLEKNLSN